MWHTTSIMILNFKALAIASLLFFSLAGCGGGQPPSAVSEEDARAVVRQYAAVAHRSYVLALDGAKKVESAIAAFVASPSAATLEAARTAWVEARPVYGRTEAFRFYGGPIDDEANNYEGRINAWPLDENFIDYVKDQPDAGIINDPTGFPELDEATLSSLNESNGEKNISIGWHAIEFLLWGQDLSTTGPGTRPYTDFVDGPSATAPNAARRRTYLRTTAALLVSDLEKVEAAWRLEDPQSYASALVAGDPWEGVRKLLTGLGQLSYTELAGERMAVALDTQDQEDEHSCFSDTTHRDLISNQEGIENVYFGRVGDLDGPGLDELVRRVAPSRADELAAQLEATRTALAKVPAPFDQAIAGGDDAPGRKAITEAIQGAKAQGESFSVVATLFGLTISLE